MDHLHNKPYVNEVTLTGQNPPLYAASLLHFVTVFTGFRSFNAQFLGSVGKRDAKFWPLNFENDSTPGKLKSGLTGLSGAGAGR